MLVFRSEAEVNQFPLKYKADKWDAAGILNVKATCLCKDIDKVYIATDSEEIRAVVESFRTSLKAEIFDNIVLIQTTSPLLTDCDGYLTDGGMYYSENGDVLKKFNTRNGVAFELIL